MAVSWRSPMALAVLLLVLGGCASPTSRERTAFEKASEKRLQAAKAGLDSLARELRVRADTLRVALGPRLDSLRTAGGLTDAKLDTLKTAERRRWHEIKGEVADMLDALEAQTDSLRAKLRR